MVKRVLKRIDHTNIFLLIAGTYTPVAICALPHTLMVVVLWVMWCGARSASRSGCFWINAPRWLYVPIYLVLGCAALGLLPQFFAASVPMTVLILSGGSPTSSARVVYGFKRPNPSPTLFGFHEVFHALTVVAFGRSGPACSSSRWTRCADRRTFLPRTGAMPGRSGRTQPELLTRYARFDQVRPFRQAHERTGGPWRDRHGLQSASAALGVVADVGPAVLVPPAAPARPSRCRRPRCRSPRPRAARGSRRGSGSGGCVGSCRRRSRIVTTATSAIAMNPTTPGVTSTSGTAEVGLGLGVAASAAAMVLTRSVPCRLGSRRTGRSPGSSVGTRASTSW